MNKEFSFSTMEEFDKHISSSIPAFDTLQESIINLSSFFIKDNSRVYDFGCSTGSLLVKLHRKHPKASFIGFDISPAIINQVYKTPIPEVDLVVQDITASDLLIHPFNFASFIFTIQFLPFGDRLSLLEKVRAAMEPGGAIVIAEKIYQPSGYLEEVISSAHYDYKRKSFSYEEMLGKQQTLRKIMKPLTEAENIQLFRSASFKSITPIWQSLNFKAWILLAN